MDYVLVTTANTSMRPAMTIPNLLDRIQLGLTILAVWEFVQSSTSFKVFFWGSFGCICVWQDGEWAHLEAWVVWVRWAVYLCGSAIQ